MLSIWEKNLYAHTYDCIIIGGGLVGTHAAINLLKARPKARILIIEKQPIGAAASTKNAGFACLGSPSELVADIQEFGTDAVAELLLWKWKGLQRTFKMLGKQKTQYKSTKAYDLFEKNVTITYEKTLDSLHHLNQILKSVTDIYPFFEPIKHTPQQLLKMPYKSTTKGN
jgi:protoporphyrinogen oxidase